MLNTVAIPLTRAVSPWVGKEGEEMNIHGIPSFSEQKKMVHDTNGDIIDLGAVVEAVTTVPSSGLRGDLPAGTRFLVDCKSGAGFILIDETGERHIASGASLRLLKHGDPERPAVLAAGDSIYGVVVGNLEVSRLRGVKTSAANAKERNVARRARRAEKAVAAKVAR